MDCPLLKSEYQQFPAVLRVARNLDCSTANEDIELSALIQHLDSNHPRWRDQYYSEVRERMCHAELVSCSIRHMQLNFSCLLLQVPPPLLDYSFQCLLASLTFDCPLFQHRPPSPAYRLSVLRFLVRHFDQLRQEVHASFLRELSALLLLPPSASPPSFILLDPPFPLAIRTLPPCEAANAVGLRCWPASYCLSGFLLEKGADLVRGCRVLELGSGCGMLGLLVAKMLGPEAVMMTDLEEAGGVMANLAWNVECNVGTEEGAVGCEVSVEEMDWGDEEGCARVIQRFQPEIVLAADVVYSPDLAPLLCRVLERALRGNGKCAFVCNACRNPETLRIFEEEMQRKKLSFSRFENEIDEGMVKRVFQFQMDDACPVVLYRITRQEEDKILDEIISTNSNGPV